MNTQNDIDSWVSALDAVGILSTQLGGHEQAKNDLLSRIRDGVLECRAQYICQEADAGKIDLDNLDWDDYRVSEPHKEQIDKTFLRPRQSKGEFVRVPNDFFLRSDGWTIDSKRCHWDRSLIVATRPAQLRTVSRHADPKASLLIRRFVFRLEFPKEVIDSLAGIEATVINESTWDAPLPGSKKRSNAGRPRSDSWNDWVAEVTKTDLTLKKALGFFTMK